MLLNFPRPGDLILVARSEWFALKYGERLRVCETPGWIVPGREIYVTPRNQVKTFWGPDWGPPDGIRPMRMSTAGGPFKTVRIDELIGLERTALVLDEFWHWQDWPRVGGGVAYDQPVTLWSLPLLIDQRFRRIRRMIQEVRHDQQ